MSAFLESLMEFFKKSWTGFLGLISGKNPKPIEQQQDAKQAQAQEEIDRQAALAEKKRKLDEIENEKLLRKKQTEADMIKLFPVLKATRTNTEKKQDNILNADQPLLCIDLGTSASTVAITRAGAIQFPLARFMGEGERAEVTMPSEVALPREPGGLGSPAVLGPIVATLQDTQQTKDFEFYHSVKRMLTDVSRTGEDASSMRARVEVRLRCLMEELLLQALCPKLSGTYAVLLDMAQRDPIYAKYPERFIEVTGLRNQATLCAQLKRHGIVLCVSVPDAFGNFEVEIIRGAVQAAGVRIAQLIESDPSVQVRLMREAQAVAWWVRSQKTQQKRDETWLVFDVGAGSSDCALLRATLNNNESQVRAIHHAGVPFAGDDIDSLMLRQMALKINPTQLKATLAGKQTWPGSFNERKPKYGVLSRALQRIAAQKPEWASGSRQNLNNQTISSYKSAYCDWLVNDTPSFDRSQALGLFPDFRETALSTALSTKDGEAIPTPQQFLSSYEKFLRAAVVGILTTIQEDVKETQPALRLDRVILSGRGGMLPMVKDLLTWMLLNMKWIDHPAQVETVQVCDEDALELGEFSPDEQESLAQKLACVRGTACAFANRSLEVEMVNRISDEILVKDGASTYPIFKRGLRIEGTRLYSCLRVPNAAAPIHNLIFYQTRIPSTAAKALRQGDSWNYRPIGMHTIQVYQQPTDVQLVFDLDSWRLTVQSQGREVSVQGTADTTFNPISGLPFGWDSE